jgi:hypothetical protein
MRIVLALSARTPNNCSVPSDRLLVLRDRHNRVIAVTRAGFAPKTKISMLRLKRTLITQSAK